MELYGLKTRDFWNDVRSEEIVNGVVTEANNLPLKLVRAGPFIPPITLPSGKVIITESCRKSIIAAGFDEFAYVEVIKEHIIELPWETWDRHASKFPVDLPQYIGGYLASIPHNARAASEMEPLWEVKLYSNAIIEWYQLFSLRGPYHLVVDRSTVPDASMFRGKKPPTILVTPTMMDCLNRIAAEWIEFSPVLFERPQRERFYIYDRQLNLNGNVNRESLAGYINDLDSDRKARRAGVDLINVSEWYIVAGKRGDLRLTHLTGRYEMQRKLTNLSRAKQLELWQHFYDGRVDLLLKEPWELEPGNPFLEPLREGPGEVVIE